MKYCKRRCNLTKEKQTSAVITTLLVKGGALGTRPVDVPDCVLFDDCFSGVGKNFCYLRTCLEREAQNNPICGRSTSKRYRTNMGLPNQTHFAAMSNSIVIKFQNCFQTYACCTRAYTCVYVCVKQDAYNMLSRVFNNSRKRVTAGKSKCHFKTSKLFQGAPFASGCRYCTQLPCHGDRVTHMWHWVHTQHYL
jgi:hypothetical protein